MELLVNTVIQSFRKTFHDLRKVVGITYIARGSVLVGRGERNYSGKVQDQHDARANYKRDRFKKKYTAVKPEYDIIADVSLTNKQAKGHGINFQDNDGDWRKQMAAGAL